ncbi:hypothetical protein DFH08DRAFT_819419 [Mycena albidolilacea]|uniref:Protein kinase domain-containing protein n=1 Tax=Mycena albidolilacea TaxID=1033008 RepID=A0AAD6ZEI3_9AGAR|nr:hypothetical protein DFH08DRAFT_819419 [Mycena albidolilacea]
MAKKARGDGAKNWGFKYRLWFMRHVWQRCSRWNSPLWPLWLTVIYGPDGNGDLWLWEEEDEEGIREFAIANGLLSVSQMTEENWNDAFQALEARSSRTIVIASPLAHLPFKTRLRFIAWLLVAGPFRKDYISQNGGIPSIAMLIDHWAYVTDNPVNRGTCHACGVSDVLSVWIETMLEVYSRDDMEALPWDRDCNCLHSQLTTTADTYLGHGVPETPLGRNSPVFHVLYELVVPAWPLFLWVVYRTGANDQVEYLTTFMDILHGPDQDLFTWDDTDDSKFLWVLVNIHQLTSYPQDWNKFMVEIPLKTWLQINNMTRIDNRLVWGFTDDDMPFRVAAMLLKYLPTPMTREKILTTLGIKLEDYRIAFDTMARTVDRDHQNWSALANFDLEEFWTSASLEDWLSACDEALCHGVWHTPIPLLERVHLMSQVNNILPCNLATYTYSLMRRRSPNHGFRGYEVLEELERIDPSFAGYLGSLQNYREDVQILVGEVKKSIEKNSSTNHTISKSVHEDMKRDVSIVMARTVVFLCDPESYKEFLKCRGTDAQQLLDLLQDLLDLDSFSVLKPFLFKALLRLSRSSGRHPQCLALSGLKTVGQQVTGGGFGDIWKGFVRGQNVCVKIMRIFEDSNVEAVLKYIQEFGREAVIWRQLCHPNLLPFFGIYYLDSRLCLVSPWMEYGNVIRFLTAEKPTNAERLSLILDVAIGLQYLHGREIVHGDLKGVRACIADFGLSAIAEAMTLRFTHSTVTARGGTARYQAPELFEGEDPARIHYGSDVYAFSCVCYEILSGMAPFHELRNDMAVMRKVANGHRPPRPMSCLATALDGLWELMQKCWEQDTHMRPTASKIVDCLAGPSIGIQMTPSTPDWNEEFTSKFRRSQQGEPLLPSVTQIERRLFGDGKFMLQVY